MLVRKLCRSGEIRVNSKRCAESDILKAGDLVRVPPIAQNRPDAKSKPDVPERGFSMSDLEKLRQCIVHDDDDIVVFDKPGGLAVQGGSGIKKSLDKMAAAMFPNDTVLLVHRLDMETSGVMVVAKNQAAAQKLSRSFQTKEVIKEYIAVLAGNVAPKEGEIDSPVDGKRAVTRYKVMGGLKNSLTFVRFRPHTGRKHQLRVHSANVLKSPIVGDDLYGGRRFDGKLKAILSPNRLYLVADRITFNHPKTGKLLTVRISVPEWMRQVAELCEVDVAGGL
jgi:23S rRNA pseudouridine955/2504/2580 synthase